MKIPFTLIILIFSFGSLVAQIVNVPDSNFKARLLEASPTINIAIDIDGNSITIDTNNNGEIEVTEALNVYALVVSSQNISDLTGIEAFTNLMYLDCKFNQISNIDLSQNLNLIDLDLFLNNLTAIDLSQNINLQSLDLGLNDLIALDLSQNINLIEINIRGNNFTEIDLSQNTALEKLIARNIDNLVVDLTQNINLKELVMNNNEINDIDLTQNIYLEHLNLGYNNLSSIDLSQNENLIFCDLRQNNLTDIDLSSNIYLEELRINYNQLNEIDLSQNYNLNHLQVQNNSLNALNVKNGSVEEILLFSSNPNLSYLCVDEAQLGQVTSSAPTSSLISTYCSFVPGGDYNIISGNITFDSDNNGCDESDYEISNIRMSIDDGTTSGSVTSNESGNYAFYTGTGNYQITPELENPNFFNISPINPTIDFTDLNNTTNQDFCITANGVHNDAEIVIVPTVPAQPGFDAYYQLVYKNKGNQILSVSIDFTYDDIVLDLISTSEVPTIQTQGSLTWNNVSLSPFESRVIEVVLNVNSPMETPAINIDDILDFSANIIPISGDETPDDNTFSLDQVVVGSYDPNDITCLEGDVVSPDKIGEYLHYNVRFENTGTAPATFVVVRDDIDEALYDLNSLQILNASHDMYTRITGNRIEFIFDNINLGPLETGNVLFKIKSLDILNVGDQVEQQAEIYFDYNFPIITNMAQTSFQALSVNEFEVESKIILYPNPSNDKFFFLSEETILSINIIDIRGRSILKAYPNSVNPIIDMSSFKSGVYFAEIESELGKQSERLIKN